MQNNWILKKIGFFLSRISVYTLGLSLPFSFEYLANENKIYGYLSVFLYFVFLTSNWYLWGKEINYRFKIYARANSSLDRILERVIIGLVLSLFIFSFIFIFGQPYTKFFYWAFWILVTLTFSWPTKRKIIDQRISFEFSELKFMDGFEKILLFLVFSLILISIPVFPEFYGTDAIKTFLDSKEVIHEQLWSFYDMVLSHGEKLRSENNFSYFVFSYFLFSTLFISSFYCLLRLNFSRKISLIGCLLLLSCRSTYSFLDTQIIDIFPVSVCIMLCWSFAWALSSSTYRSGFLVGVIGYFCTIVNIKILFLHMVFMITFLVMAKKNRSSWYLRQFLKYTSLGGVFTLLTLLLHHGFDLNNQLYLFPEILKSSQNLFQKKAIFILSIPGLFFLFKDIFDGKEETNLLRVFILLTIAFLWGLFLETMAIRSFFLLALFSFLSIFPISKIIIRLNPLKNKANLIFLVYIVFCLLDSSLEYRIKNLLNWL